MCVFFSQKMFCQINLTEPQMLSIRESSYCYNCLASIWKEKKKVYVASRKKKNYSFKNSLCIQVYVCCFEKMVPTLFSNFA